MIVLQTIILNTTETTFISSAQPNTNFSIYPVVYAGLDEIYQSCMGFLRFELPILPVASVQKALLEISILLKTNESPSTIVFNRVTSAINTSTVTYNTKPTFVETSVQADITSADLYTAIQIDVTALVNDWLGGTYPNYGFAITNTEEGSLVQFASRNISYEPYYPKLSLTYSGTTVEPEIENPTEE